MKTYRTVMGVAAAAALIITSWSSPAAQSDEEARLREATTVFEEIMSASDSAIPNSVLGGAAGVAIFPSTLKVGLVIGGHRGRGVLSARDPDTKEWSRPAFLTLTGGSFGAQIGGQSIDLVLIVRNRRGLENLVSNEFKIGVDASVAAGPVGRDAEASTDIQLRAEILSYSRTRGLFAGVTLKGTSIRQDRDANEFYYGYPWRTRELVFEGKGETSPAVQSFTDLLKKHAG